MLIWSPLRDRVASVKRALRAVGLRGVRLGASVEGAIEEVHPAALVIDAVSTASEALETCEALRHAGASVRSILLLVGAGDTRALEAALELGISSFAEEPFTPEGVAWAVRGLLLPPIATRAGADSLQACAGPSPRDGLTGLSSRPALLETMRAVLAQARERGHRAAILYLDIDRFKAVNDALGHAAGDALLQNVARILEGQVRATDLVTAAPTRELDDAYRVGGDEFTVLLSKLAQAEDALDVARRIQASMRAPMLAEGYQVAATASIGIAIFPDDAQEAEDLLRCADMAMYAAKDAGRGRYTFYEPSMGDLQHRRLEIEEALRHALDRDEFQLKYQPRVDLAHDAVVGTEALIRWHPPALGEIQPREFIPVAEECGLIVSIENWVLKTACAQLAAWRLEGLNGLRISVNVSSRQLASHGFLNLVTDVLRSTGLEPHALELEVTERSMLGADERTALAFRDLHGIGVTLALDDFGTGYSSLSSIVQHPIDVLKIDRSLAADVDQNPAAASIVSAVITLARSLGLSVVGEGVDSIEQVRVLRGLGCDEVQGFLVSPAVDAPALAALCKGWQGLERLGSVADEADPATVASSGPEDLPAEVEKPS